MTGDKLVAVPVTTGMPTIYTPPTKTATVSAAGLSAPTAAAGAELAGQNSGGFATLAGFFGPLLTPLSQALGQRIAGQNNTTPTSGTPAPAVGAGMSSSQLLLVVLLGVAALFIGLLILKRA